MDTDTNTNKDTTVIDMEKDTVMDMDTDISNKYR
jgi:hypothetical protein